MLAEDVIVEVLHLFCHYFAAEEYFILLGLHLVVQLLQAERSEERLQHCVQVASIAQILDAPMWGSSDLYLALDCKLCPGFSDELLEASQFQN